MDVTALIVAAGTGSRMGEGLPKQFRPIGGKAVLAHAVDALAGHPRIGAVRVVIGPGQEAQAQAALGSRDVGSLILGGTERADSVGPDLRPWKVRSCWSMTPPVPSVRPASSTACW
jgi:2-C-methyl-D-erythritol 4-phosphate cytidylyltransferase/2-C-methyl-D-erythritol 2,4-cyclodiphosphate synthase